MRKCKSYLHGKIQERWELGSFEVVSKLGNGKLLADFDPIFLL
jgi:hypothetical protein